MLATSHSPRYDTVLVAGAGDLGLCVARRLAARGQRVFALRRSACVPGDGIHALRGDLTDPASLSGLPAVDAVVFAPTPDARDEPAYRAIFVDGLRHLLDALPASPARTVFVSSSAVYGEHAGDWVDETTPTDPPGFNGRVLVEAERWLSERDAGGVAVRLAGLYGPGRTQLFDRIRTGGARVPRDAGVYANRIHIDDAAAAIVTVLDIAVPQPVYVGVDDTPLPIDVLYDHIAAVLGAPRPGDGPAPAGIGNKRLSNARLRAAGFRPAWPDARDGYAALAAGA